MTTGKNLALIRWTFVGKIMPLLFNVLSRLVITFLPRSKHLLISWLQSPSEWSGVFPYFLPFKSEFGNKGFMIQATVSSQSWFCLLDRASPSLAAKNIISLISVDHLVMSICRVFSWVVGRRCLLWPVHSLGRTPRLMPCPASFRTPRPNLPVTPGASWRPTFAFQSPIIKNVIFFRC